MLIKKIAYWGAGLACSGVIFLVGVIVADSLYVSPHYTAQIHSNIKSHFGNIYLACMAYWKDTNPANACNVDIVSGTTYSYIQDADITIWGEGGNQYDFNLKGKSRQRDSVFSLEVKTIKGKPLDFQFHEKIRRLKNKELESALAEFNKLKDHDKTP